MLIKEKAKIIISDKVFDKIKYLCHKFNPVEWSGIIWMDIEGSVEKPEELKIKLIDLTLLDIGSSAYTEFVIEPEIILPIYDKHPDYVTKKYGCIHSHNNMNVFFSGTDTSTLLEQAFIHNFFVSVIVNNKYEKIAKISYEGKKTVSTIETFYNRIGKLMLPYKKEIIEEEPVVCVIECDVEYESAIPVNEELDNEIEILLRKEREKEALREQFNQKNKHIGGFKTVKRLGESFHLNAPSKARTLFDDIIEEKVSSAKENFSEKCETFVKRVLCIDYTGDETEELSIVQARELWDEWYGDQSIVEYLDEVKEFAKDLFPKFFAKELEANWYEESKFKRLKIMLASQFEKLVDMTNPVEKDIFEIIDYILKETEEERNDEFNK